MNTTPAKPQFVNVRVVVVEDDAAMRLFIVGTLKRIGISAITECADGATALKVVTEKRPDLILSDIHMRPVNGLDFVQQVRSLADPVLRATPVIFMTADSNQTTLAAALPLNISGYIVKPPRAADLAAKIAVALG